MRGLHRRTNGVQRLIAILPKLSSASHGHPEPPRSLKFRIPPIRLIPTMDVANGKSVSVFLFGSQGKGIIPSMQLLSSNAPFRSDKRLKNGNWLAAELGGRRDSVRQRLPAQPKSCGCLSV